MNNFARKVKLYGAFALRSRYRLFQLGSNLIWLRREEFTGVSRNAFSNDSWSDFDRPYYFYELVNKVWRRVTLGTGGVDHLNAYTSTAPGYGFLIDAGVEGNETACVYYIFEETGDPSIHVGRTTTNGDTWNIVSSRSGAEALNWKAFLDTPSFRITEQMYLPVRYLLGYTNYDDRGIYAPTPVSIPNGANPPTYYVPGSEVIEWSYVYPTGPNTGYATGYQFDHINEWNNEVWVEFHAPVTISLSGITCSSGKVFLPEGQFEPGNRGFRGVIRIGYTEALACRKEVHSNHFSYRLVYTSNGGGSWEDRGVYPGTVENAYSDPNESTNWNDHTLHVFNNLISGQANVKWATVDTVPTACGGLVMFESIEFFRPPGDLFVNHPNIYTLSYAPDRYDPFTKQVIDTITVPSPIGNYSFRNNVRFTGPNLAVYVKDPTRDLTQLTNTQPVTYTVDVTTTSRTTINLSDYVSSAGREIVSVELITYIAPPDPPGYPLDGYRPTWDYTNTQAGNRCTWEVDEITLPPDNPLPIVFPPFDSSLPYSLQIRFTAVECATWEIHELTFTTENYTIKKIGAMDETGRRRDIAPFFFCPKVSSELGGNGWETLKDTVAPLSILSATLPDGYLDDADYAFSFLFTGGKSPVYFRVAEGSTLPPGLSLDMSGYLQGPLDVPSIEATIGAEEYQTYAFNIEAYDSKSPTAQVSTKTYSMRVANHGIGGQTFRITTERSVVEQFIALSSLNTTFSFQFAAAGGVEPYQYWSWNYPTPLANYATFDADTATLHGTLPQSLNLSDNTMRLPFQLEVLDSSPEVQTASAAYGLQVLGKFRFKLGEFYTLPELTLVNHPGNPDEIWVDLDYVYGDPADSVLQGGYNAQGTNWIISAGSLPPGVSLAVFNGIGMISGRIEVAGTYNWTVSVDNLPPGTPSANQTASINMTLVVNPLV